MLGVPRSRRGSRRAGIAEVGQAAIHRAARRSAISPERLEHQRRNRPAEGPLPTGAIDRELPR
jgi:hypothetical protein